MVKEKNPAQELNENSKGRIAVSCAKAEQQIGEEKEAIQKAKQAAEEAISKKLGLEEFDLKDVNFAYAHEGCLLSVWGKATARELFGLEPWYIYINVDTHKNYVKLISEAVKELDETIKWDELYFNPHAKKDKKVEDAYIDVYASVAAAVEYSYNCLYEKIAEASSIDYRIKMLPHYNYPSLEQDEEKHDIIIKNSIQLVNVSGVMRDYAQGTCYFYVDTLQGFDQNGRVVVSVCRARIDVDGIETPDYEAYAKFVAGEIGEDYGFKEVFREPIGISALPAENEEESKL